MENVYIIEAQTLDWVYVITRLIKRHNPKPMDVKIAPNGDGMIYYVAKNLFTAQDLADAVGSTADAVNRAERVKLLPLDDDSKYPRATVAYVGEA